MKKLYYVVIVLGLLMFAGAAYYSCTCHSLTDYIIKDYETVLNENPRAKYYETECVLNGYLDEVKDKAKVVSYRQIHQVADSVHYYNRNFEDNTLSVTKQYGHWSGTFKADPHDMLVGFNDALDILMENNVVLPHSNKMTLRCPMGAESYNLKYIFGSTKSKLYIYVDAVTGEVGQMGKHED